MSDFEIEDVLLLTKHAQRLRVSLSVIHKLLKSQNSPLQAKEIVDLVKALKDGKGDKVSNFSAATIDELGKNLRYSYSVLQHLRLFQEAAIDKLNAAANSGRQWDLSMNYPFVAPIMNLYTEYVRLNVFLTLIPDIEKIPITYNFCYKRKTGENCECFEIINTFVNNRTQFTLLEEELQPLSEFIYNMFKGIISVFMRLLTANSSFEWSLLSISDNPELCIPPSTFYRPEYLILMNLDKISDWFISFIFINLRMISNDAQIGEAFQILILHRSVFPMHGGITISLKSIFEKMKKIVAKAKRKADFDSSIFEKSDLKIQNSRMYRRTRLVLAFDEAMYSIKVDPNVLPLKLPVVLSLLGFAHFEISTLLEANAKVEVDPSNIALVSALTRLTTLCLKNVDTVQRFLMFNIHEYDAPYLDTKIHSFNIPKTEFDKLELVIQAMRSINIENYDNGTRYDISGLLVMITRVMTSFNKFSTNHGVLHLSELFNLISLIYFHVTVANDIVGTILQSAPLPTYWRFNSQLIQMSKKISHEDAGHISSILGLAHYYSFYVDMIAENQKYKEQISDYVKDAIDIVTGAVIEWSRVLHSNSFAQLQKQVSIANVLFQLQQHDGKKKVVLSTKDLANIPVGEESQLENRAVIQSLYTPIRSIILSLDLIQEYGTIQIFDKKINLVESLVQKFSGFVKSIFEKEPIAPPADFLNKITAAEYIIHIAMSSLSVNPRTIIKKGFDDIRTASVRKGDYGYHVEGELGYLPTIFQEFYKNFFTKTIKNTYYSNTTQAFMPSSSNSTEKPSNYASRAALRNLHELLKTPGIAVIDILAVDTINTLMTKLSDLLTPYKTDKDAVKKSYIDDPSTIVESSDILGYLCHIGAILKFRKLLRQSIKFDKDAEPDYQFLAQFNSPQEDECLNLKIKNHALLPLFTNESFAYIFGGLMGSDFWDGIEYDILNDGFHNNSHLLVLTFDALVGATIANKSDYSYQNKFCNIISQTASGISNGQDHYVQSKKKNPYPATYMYLLLDHIIRSSYYADYSMLEQYVSYQYIRSLYTSTLRKFNKKEEKEKMNKKSTQPKATDDNKANTQPSQTATNTEAKKDDDKAQAKPKTSEDKNKEKAKKTDKPKKKASKK